VRLLLADAEGEQTFQDLAPDDDAPAASVGEDVQI